MCRELPANVFKLRVPIATAHVGLGGPQDLQNFAGEREREREREQERESHTQSNREVMCQRECQKLEGHGKWQRGMNSLETRRSVLSLGSQNAHT